MLSPRPASSWPLSLHRLDRFPGLRATARGDVLFHDLDRGQLGQLRRALGRGRLGRRCLGLMALLPGAAASAARPGESIISDDVAPRTATTRICRTPKPSVALPKGSDSVHDEVTGLERADHPRQPGRRARRGDPCSKTSSSTSVRPRAWCSGAVDRSFSIVGTTRLHAGPRIVQRGGGLLVVQHPGLVGVQDAVAEPHQLTGLDQLDVDRIDAQFNS